MSKNESESFAQLDGNVSICSNTTTNSGHHQNINNNGRHQNINKKGRHQNNKKQKKDQISSALCLPVVATYNLRSLIPKIQSLKNDIVERSVSLAFLQEIWEQTDNKSHQFEIEKLLELHGLQYISNPRPKNTKGRSYGGTAIIINQEKFSCEKLNILIPSNLEVVWGLVKPKNQSSNFNKIIACSFYSPPNKNKKLKVS